MKNLPAYIGITAAISMAVCDMILLAQPVSGSYYDISSFEALGNISWLRAGIGSTVGLVCAFFICFGFWHLKNVFEPVNKKLAMMLFISLCSVEFFGGAFHASYYFVASASPLTNFEVSNELQDFRLHSEILSYLGVPGFVAGTILFFKLGMDKRFPAWFKFANPLIICGFMMFLFMVLPAPVGGYLRPTFINTGLTIMFLLSLRVA